MVSVHLQTGRKAPPMQSWFFLFGAILFEVSGTMSMKFSEGFSKPIPSVLIFVFYGIAFFALTLALKKIDISIAYAVWSGLGTALIACIGIFYFHEPVSAVKILCIGLIIAGAAGLHYTGLRHG